MKSTKRKLRRLKFFSWIGLLSPISALMIYNASDYFTLDNGFLFPQSVELGIGVIISLVSGIMLAVGKSSLFKGSRGLAIMLILSILLNSIIKDIVYVLSALTLGSFIYEQFQPTINETLDTYKFEKQAGIQAKAFNNVRDESKVKETVRSGRV